MGCADIRKVAQTYLIRQIEATGTKTLWIKADPPNVNLLNPEEILPALRVGYDRAKKEAGTIKAFGS